MALRPCLPAGLVSASPPERHSRCKTSGVGQGLFGVGVVTSRERSPGRKRGSGQQGASSEEVTWESLDGQEKGTGSQRAGKVTLP